MMACTSTENARSLHLLIGIKNSSNQQDQNQRSTHQDKNDEVKYELKVGQERIRKQPKRFTTGMPLFLMMTMFVAIVKINPVLSTNEFDYSSLELQRQQQENVGVDKVQLPIQKRKIQKQQIHRILQDEKDDTEEPKPDNADESSNPSNTAETNNNEEENENSNNNNNNSTNVTNNNSSTINDDNSGTAEKDMSNSTENESDSDNSSSSTGGSSLVTDIIQLIPFDVELALMGGGGGGGNNGTDEISSSLIPLGEIAEIVKMWLNNHYTILLNEFLKNRISNGEADINNMDPSYASFSGVVLLRRTRRRLLRNKQQQQQQPPYVRQNIDDTNQLPSSVLTRRVQATDNNETTSTSDAGVDVVYLYTAQFTGAAYFSRLVFDNELASTSDAPNGTSSSMVVLPVPEDIVLQIQRIIFGGSGSNSADATVGTYTNSLLEQLQSTTNELLGSNVVDVKLQLVNDNGNEMDNNRDSSDFSNGENNNDTSAINELEIVIIVAIGVAVLAFLFLLAALYWAYLYDKKNRDAFRVDQRQQNRNNNKNNNSNPRPITTKTNTNTSATNSNINTTSKGKISRWNLLGRMHKKLESSNIDKTDSDETPPPKSEVVPHSSKPPTYFHPYMDHDQDHPNNQSHHHHHNHPFPREIVGGSIIGNQVYAESVMSDSIIDVLSERGANDGYLYAHNSNIGGGGGMGPSPSHHNHSSRSDPSTPSPIKIIAVTSTTKNGTSAGDHTYENNNTRQHSNHHRDLMNNNENSSVPINSNSVIPPDDDVSVSLSLYHRSGMGKVAYPVPGSNSNLYNNPNTRTSRGVNYYQQQQEQQQQRHQQNLHNDNASVSSMESYGFSLDGTIPTIMSPSVGGGNGGYSSYSHYNEGSMQLDSTIQSSEDIISGAYDGEEEEEQQPNNYYNIQLERIGGGGVAPATAAGVVEQEKETSPEDGGDYRNNRSPNHFTNDSLVGYQNNDNDNDYDDDEDNTSQPTIDDLCTVEGSTRDFS